MQRSPTIAGFRAMFRRPSFGLAEIAWRWSFGFAACAVLGFCFIEYLDSLPVSASDLFLLRTRQPALVSQALEHILRGSGARLVEALIILSLAMVLAWIGTTTMGRAVTLTALLDYAVAEGVASAGAERKWRMGTLAELNFLRVAVALAAIVGCVGAWLLGAAVSPEKDPSPGSAVLVFLAMAMLVWLAWSVINWFLSLASVFAVAQGTDTFASLAAAGDLCRERTGSVAAASAWFGLAHLAGFVVASSVVAFPLAFAAVLPGAVVLGGMLLVTLLYFALADFLYAGRLAAYVFIAQGPTPAPVPLNDSHQPPLLGVQIDERVDPDELILGDTPLAGEA